MTNRIESSNGALMCYRSSAYHLHLLPIDRVVPSQGALLCSQNTEINGRIHNSSSKPSSDGAQWCGAA